MRLAGGEKRKLYPWASELLGVENSKLGEGENIGETVDRYMKNMQKLF